jgi:MoxR-like ATPase
MSDVQSFDLDLVRSTAAELDLATLPKDSLVELTRRVFGVVGDSARTPKATYLGKLTATDREKVNEGIVAMVIAGELDFDLGGDEEEAPAPARRAPQQRNGEAVADESDVARKLREAFSALGIGGKAEAAPLDEGRVREIAGELMQAEARVTQEALSVTLRNEFADAIAVAMRDLKLPERIIVVTPQGERKKIEGHTHAVFERVLAHASIRDNILLVGPAGCGKTQLAHQVADALSLPFSFIACTSGMSETQLTGWLLPIGESGRFAYVPSSFVAAYENGGLFLLDEIDAADENVLLVINSALANGHMAIPQRHDNPIAKRHDDFVLIAAANTFGHGADRMYAGRNQLDGATLDRFRTAIVEMGYDGALEEALIDEPVLQWGRSIRDAIGQHKLRRVMSTRVLIGFTRQRRALKWGRKEFELSYFADWTKDELTKVGR